MVKGKAWYEMALRRLQEAKDHAKKSKAKTESGIARNRTRVWFWQNEVDQNL